MAENIRKEKSEPLSQDVEKVSTTANIPISHGLSVYTAIRKTQVNTEVDIEKKPDMYVSNSFLKKKRVTDGDEGYCEAPKQAKLLRTIETQTDCSFVKKNILPQVTRSKDELASVQITFFLNSAVSYRSSSARLYLRIEKLFSMNRSKPLRRLSMMKLQLDQIIVRWEIILLVLKGISMLF